ncbi:unnamed protein product [Urochloa humidicola]
MFVTSQVKASRNMHHVYFLLEKWIRSRLAMMKHSWFHWPVSLNMGELNSNDNAMVHDNEMVDGNGVINGNEPIQDI